MVPLWRLVVCKFPKNPAPQQYQSRWWQLKYVLFVTPSLGFHSLQFDVRVGEKPPTSCPQILPHLWLDQSWGQRFAQAFSVWGGLWGKIGFFGRRRKEATEANDLISRSTSACCKVNCWVLPLQWRIWAGFWGFPIEFQELLWFFVCCSSYVVTFNVMEVTQRLFGMHMLFVVEGTWAPNMHL